MRQLVLPRTQPIADLALSPDGQTLAVAHRNHGLSLYDPFAGRVTFEARGHYSRLRFRDDGRWLLAANPGAVVVSFEGDRPREVYLHLPEYIYHANFEPEDAVSVLGNNHLRTLRLPDEGEVYGQNLESFHVAECRINPPTTRAALVPVGLTATRIVGVELGRLGSEAGMFAIGFRREEWSVTAVVVDAADNRLLAVVDTPSLFNGTPVASHFRQHGDWFAVGTNHELAVYSWSDLPALVPSAREPRRRGVFQTVRETFLGVSVAAFQEQRYGHLPTLRPRHRLPAVGTPPVDPLPVAFLPDGSGFLCRGAGAAVELRDTATGRVRMSWQFQRAWPRVLAVAPDGLTAMAAIRGGTVVFWDLE